MSTTTPAQRTRASLLLALTAAIWGLGFVAQRLGADHMGGLSFNAVRFAIGALSLVPLIWWLGRRRRAAPTVWPEPPAAEPGSSAGTPADSPATPNASPMVPGAITGAVLFTAAGLQQVGIADSTAGKAAFITGLYMLVVPLLGLVLGLRVHPSVWLGIALALPGLWLLSVPGSLSIARGDLLVLLGAVFWAVHILVIDHFGATVDALQLSAVQFAACAVLSALGAVLLEDDPFAGLSPALGAVLYGGLVAVGIAYTLQVVAQRDALPSHAALLLSLESVFGALGGWLLLGESMTTRMLVGASLMMVGILLPLLLTPRPAADVAGAAGTGPGSG